ncbi:uncharacterized protein ACMZJ9_018746 isoform 1-T1 [Mantella aurantiaca]
MTTMRALLVLLSVLPLIFCNSDAYGEDPAGLSCPEGAEMSDCSDCFDHCQPPGTVCHTMCEQGCKCKKSGYVIKDNKKCVPKSECELCPPGAEMSNCTGCSDHCPSTGMACTKKCKKGCKCKQDGYVLKYEHLCVPKNQC